jgi:hypothetical protein
MDVSCAHGLGWWHLILDFWWIVILTPPYLYNYFKDKIWWLNR